MKAIFQTNFVIIFLVCVLAGCGYSFQGKTHPWTTDGLNKVYVDVMSNNSLRAGTEVAFTSAFVKYFSRGNKLKVVQKESDADLIVRASVDSIANNISSSTTVPQLTEDPAAKVLDDYVVATEYSASAAVSVSFIRRRDSVTLMSQSFSRSKIYPANNRFGKPGTTSVLINDSQASMALSEIANGIAGDAYDSMLEAF